MKDTFFAIQNYIESQYEAEVSLIFSVADEPLTDPLLQIIFTNTQFTMQISYSEILEAQFECGLLATLQLIDNTIAEDCVDFFLRTPNEDEY